MDRAEAALHALLAGIQASDHVDPKLLEQLAGRVQPGAGVVVPTHDDHLTDRGRGEAVEEPIVLSERLGRRVPVVEHVTGDDQDLHLVLFDRLGEPAQELSVILLSRNLLEGIAQVPIGCVENFHAGPQVDVCMVLAVAVVVQKQTPLLHGGRRLQAAGTEP